jgi:hypothetical protein
MTRLGEFLRLPPVDRRLLVTAAVLQAAIKLGLALLPYRRLRGLVDRLARTGRLRQLAPPASAERIVLAVTRASRVVPGATCLPQALAAKVLLERRGHPAYVHVGVMRADDARVLAHAWVESAGRILLGGGDLAGYTPLSAFEPIPPAGGDAHAEGEPRLAR